MEIARVMPTTVALAALLLLSACNQQPEPQSSAGAPAETEHNNGAGYRPAFANQTRAPNLKAGVAFAVVPVVRSGLEKPFGFTFLPDGRYLITERPGRLRIAAADGTLSAPVAGAPKVDAEGQGGLLDVALDPRFAENRLVYLSYAEPAAGGGNHTAVARGRLIDGAQPRLDGLQVIYRQAPSLNSKLHYGSRLVFAPDGALFITQGERSIVPGRMQARKMDSLLGKIVRIRSDGAVPADNPFVGKPGVRPEIWSNGHRNVQAASLHPKTGELWVVDHGPQGGDEVNIVRKGLDYGWPTITYGVEYGPGARRIGEGPTAPGLEQPIYYWDPVIAPGGMAFYEADLFPKWKGSLFVGGLNTGYIARLTLDGDKVVGEERFSISEERNRDLKVGPDGALYVLIDGEPGRLVKLVPK
jgi:glucose/arabinose dehydrogenase